MIDGIERTFLTLVCSPKTRKSFYSTNFFFDQLKASSFSMFVFFDTTEFSKKKKVFLRRFYLFSCLELLSPVSLSSVPGVSLSACLDFAEILSLFTTRWRLETWADCAQKLWQACSLGEGNIIYKYPHSRDTVQNYDMSLRTFFMHPRALHRLKSFAFRYLAEVSVRKVLS